MYRPLTAGALACLLGFIPAMSSLAEEKPEANGSDIIISSGIEGGGYWSAASRLKGVAADLDLPIQVQASTGSINNLEQLTDGNSPVNLAFAQADALQFFLDSHPGTASRIETIENIGQECVFVITNKDSAIRTDADLQEKANHRLGISSADSGVAVTFAYMASQLAGLKNTQVVFGDTESAMAKLGDEDASVDAVMVVHRPREHSAEVSKVLQQPDSYRFVEILDERLSRQASGGEAIYQTLNLAMPPTADGTRLRVKTICVKGLLLANKEKLNGEHRDKLSDLVNRHWMKVYATE